MKVFGYRNPEIRRFYLNATTITVLVSLVVTLLAVYLALGAVFLLMFIQMNSYLPLFVPWYVFAEILAIGTVSYFVINDDNLLDGGIQRA